MENIWITIITGVLSLFVGGGLWAWIKAHEDKRKTPYVMERITVQRDDFNNE